MLLDNTVADGQTAGWSLQFMLLQCSCSLVGARCLMVTYLNFINFVGSGEDCQPEHAACGLTLVDQQTISHDTAHMQCKLINFLVLAMHTFALQTHSRKDDGHPCH